MIEPKFDLVIYRMDVLHHNSYCRNVAKRRFYAASSFDDVDQFYLEF